RNLYQVADNKSRLLPLYEARMIFQFDHRYASIEINPDNTFRQATSVELSEVDHINPEFVPLPRFWVKEKHVHDKTKKKYPYVIGYRMVTSSTNARTAVFCVVPECAASNMFPFVFAEEAAKLQGVLIANFNSFALDYVLRQKFNSQALNFYIVKQLPVIPPHAYIETMLDFITSRVLELTYTAWDLRSFAQDVGYDGPPFVWDEERRFLMRCELDALYFHLYGIQRNDADYIMETFWT